MARRRSTSRTTRTANAARRSAAARKGWQTRRANAAKRSAASKKGWKTRRTNERRQFKLKRERDKRRASATSFDFGANVAPEPISRARIRQDRERFAGEDEPPIVYESLDEWIEDYDDYDDYDVEDYDATPDYEGKGKK